MEVLSHLVNKCALLLGFQGLIYLFHDTKHAWGYSMQATATQKGSLEGEGCRVRAVVTGSGRFAAQHREHTRGEAEFGDSRIESKCEIEAGGLLTSRICGFS
jgi:hypothetical protein